MIKVILGVKILEPKGSRMHQGAILKTFKKTWSWSFQNNFKTLAIWDVFHYYRGVS